MQYMLKFTSSPTAQLALGSGPSFGPEIAPWPPAADLGHLDLVPDLVPGPPPGPRHELMAQPIASGAQANHNTQHP